MLKTCTKCKRELSIDNFYKQSKNKDGLHYWCKKCVKEYYEINSETISIKSKLRYQNNSINIIENVHRYREENYEKALASNRKSKLKNKGKIKIKNKKYKNDKKSDPHFKAMRIKDAETRRARKEKLEATLTDNQWEDIKQRFDNKCAYCNKELPLAQEHFIPLSKGGEYTINNIIPSCKSCNSSKNSKSFCEWYPKYRYYSKRREKFILNFLHYKDGQQQLTLII